MLLISNPELKLNYNLFIYYIVFFNNKQDSQEDLTTVSLLNPKKLKYSAVSRLIISPGTTAATPGGQGQTARAAMRPAAESAFTVSHGESNASRGERTVLGGMPSKYSGIV